MAQTKRKRRRKHRGTQGGSIDRRRRAGRPRSREEARAQARRQQEAKRDRPPTWGGAINRALLMSGILFVLFVLVLQRGAAESLGLAATMMLVYVPAGYYLERFLYSRRKAAERRARAKRAAEADRR
jgi:cytochrome c-type biogenesis protein CcmH/NrfG